MSELGLLLWYQINVSICAILGIIILCYHIKNVMCSKQKKSTDDIDYESKFIKLLLSNKQLPNFAFIQYLIQLYLANVLNYWGFLQLFENVLNCDAYNKVVAAQFLITKASLYLVLISRLIIAYHNSIYKYSNKLIHTLLCSVCLYVFIGVTICVYSATGHLLTLKHITYCQFIFEESKQLLSFIISFYDLFISFFCVYLFCKPLYKLIVKDANTLTNDRTLDVIIKSGILTTFCVTTTFITLVSYVFSEKTDFFADDAIVNAMCILMISYAKIYNRFYFAIFGKLHNKLKSIHANRLNISTVNHLNGGQEIVASATDEMTGTTQQITIDPVSSDNEQNKTLDVTPEPTKESDVTHDLSY
eukprot:92614_1